MASAYRVLIVGETIFAEALKQVLRGEDIIASIELAGPGESITEQACQRGWDVIIYASTAANRPALLSLLETCPNLSIIGMNLIANQMEVITSKVLTGERATQMETLRSVLGSLPI